MQNTDIKKEDILALIRKYRKELTKSVLSF